MQHNNKKNCDATLIVLARKRAQVQLFTKPSTLYSTHFPTFPTFLVKPAHYTRVTFLKKSSPKVFKKLPKTGSSNQPMLAANAKLGTLFFGTLKNQDFQSWKSCLLSSSVHPPKIFWEKSRFFRTDRQTHTHTHTSSLDHAHGRKERFAQLYQISFLGRTNKT